jgi:hypothetical protein
VSAGRQRLLLATLTDGKRECHALEAAPVKGLSLDTPPGTKLRVTRAPVLHGVLLLGRRPVLAPPLCPRASRRGEARRARG